MKFVGAHVSASGGVFNAPNHGLIKMDHATKEVSAYRFHTRDRINFTKSISVEMEHGQRTYNDAKADFSSIAYWYQTEPNKNLKPISDDREPIVVGEAFLLPGAIEFEGHENQDMPYYMSTYHEGDERWSNDMGALFLLKEDGDNIEKEFDVAEDGEYEIGINYIVNDHSAIFVVEVDGVQIGNDIDGYGEDKLDAYLLCRNKASGLKNIGSVKLKKGKHILTVKVVGKNSKSKEKHLLLDCVTVNKKG